MPEYALLTINNFNIFVLFLDANCALVLSGIRKPVSAKSCLDAYKKAFGAVT